MSKLEQPLLPEGQEMENFDVYEDNDSFRRLRAITVQPLMIFRPNCKQFLELLDTAFTNSTEGISLLEERESLKILRDYDPILYDIMYDICDFDLNVAYQTILKKMIVKLHVSEAEVNRKYKEILGWYSLTGKVPASSAQYADFVTNNCPRIMRNLLIVFTILVGFPVFLIVVIIALNP